MKRSFCTCFDHNYLIYGLTLFESLKTYMQDFELYVLCLSVEVYQKLHGLAPEIIPVPLQALEDFVPELMSCKNDRSRTEYIFTLSPLLPLYLFSKYSNLKQLAYLDSDLYFFASPESLFEKMADRSLFITSHRFSIMAEKREALYGKYNVAFQIYRNDAVGIACLTQWKKQCLDWCYDRAENGKFADQKYLDTWPEQWHDSVVVASCPGINDALWNIGKTAFQKTSAGIFSDGNPLIFFHFQGFKQLAPHIALWPQEEDYRTNIKFINFFAKVYLKALIAVQKKYSFLFDYKISIPVRFFEERLKFTRMEKFISWIPGKKLQLFLRVIYFCLRNRNAIFFKF